MIEIRALTKRFAGVTAVDALSFAAPAGSVTGFLGPNGAGKTTTLRCLLGLARATSGRALIDGSEYRDLPSPRRIVGAMLESTGFHPARTGRNHLKVIARAARLDVTRIDPLLELAELSGAADRAVGGYSLGMRQRLGLAAAMLGDPAVVVLDEPANGLDPAGISWVRGLLRRWADEGRTVLVSSHLLAEVAQAVDRVVIIRDGSLVTQTDIATLAADRITVRVDRPDALIGALLCDGAEFEIAADGAIAISGVDAGEIAVLATRTGTVITELARSSPSVALETLFLAATGGSER